jgi:GNAT superfamily N-acetyltransferase
MTVSIRLASASDVPSLVALNRAAYPDLLEDDVVFDEETLRAHLRVFPRGQLVAESDGRIVGAIATLILPDEIDPLAPHTWTGVTDDGTFARHDDHGATLYLADVYVDASAWGRGVGRALYAALFDLCRRERCARVVAGGRLYDYVEHAAHMSPAEYVACVVRGELSDRVLRSQLRAGFAVKGLLPGYLPDWRSRHWATLLVWDNPDVPKVAAASEPALPAPPALLDLAAQRAPLAVGPNA